MEKEEGFEIVLADDGTEVRLTQKPGQTRFDSLRDMMDWAINRLPDAELVSAVKIGRQGVRGT